MMQANGMQRNYRPAKLLQDMSSCLRLVKLHQLTGRLPAFGMLVN